MGKKGKSKEMKLKDCKVFGGIMLAVLLMTAQVISAAQEAFPYLAKINADKVIVRAGQNINFEILGQLDKDEEVVVVAKSYGWNKIKLPIHARSYISCKYLDEKWDNVADVKGNRVNVRAGPGGKYAVVGQISKGERVLIKEKLEGWCRIQPPETCFGWISEEYLTYVSQEIPSPRVVELPTRNVYVRKRMAEHAQRIAAKKEQIPQAAKEISAIGQIGIIQETTAQKGLRYRLYVNDQTAYWLMGPSDLLEKFLESKVVIEGTLDYQFSRSSPYPVVKVTKIKLIL